MRYRVPSRLAHVVMPGERGDLAVYLLKLPDGDPLALIGSAAAIWVVAADGASDVPAAVAAAVGRPTGDVDADVRGYLAYLLGEGLLEEVP